MANLLIDPYLFACPIKPISKTEFIDYVDLLLEWQDLKDSDWVKLYTLKECHEVLLNTDRYPIWDSVHNCVKQFKIDYIQPKDVINLVDSFLDKIVKIQDHLGINEILYQHPEITPPIEHSESLFWEKVTDLLNYGALKCNLHNESEYSQIMLIAKYNHPRITLKSQIIDIEFINPVNIKLPFDVNNSFSTCKSYSNLCYIIDPNSIWKNSFSESNCLTALKFYTIKSIIEGGQNINILNKKHYSFNKDFLQTVEQLHFHKDKTKIEGVLKSMSDIILDISLNSVHALRTSKGGNSPQVSDGNFKAWRKDIDHEYHLHYWKAGDEIIFSNVVVHNDFKISSL